METIPPATLTAQAVADALQEPNRELLIRVLKRLGPERTASLLAETLQCEANGGMQTKDGARRRTPGGTFFQLTRERTTARERAWIFAIPTSPPPQHTTAGTRTSQPPTVAPLTADMVQTLLTLPQGDATVKITLIGRPDMKAVRSQPTYVAFRMAGTPPPSLPRGLPAVPGQAPITWLVTIATRQWNRVYDSLTANPDDKLIIEGYPVVIGDGTHVLLVQGCTTVALQRERKAVQQSAPPTSP